MSDRAVRHSNPVTDAGFTQIPNVVMLRRDLSPVAKLVYGYLKHLAWRNGGEGAASPLEEMADDLGMSDRTLRGYIAELKKAPVAEGGSESLPRLVVAERRGLGLPNAYVINDPILPDGSEDSSGLTGRSRRSPRARDPLESKTSSQEGAIAPVGVRDPAAAPPLRKLDGQDLAMNALAGVCGVNPTGGRARELAAALSGRGGEVGIRDQFWRECVAYAEETGQEDRLVEAAGRFETALVRAIQRKATLYRERFGPAVELTPGALRKWWSDLETRTARGSGLSAEEMAAYDA